MIVDGDREHLLGVVLPDDVVVEHLADLFGRGDAVARLHQRGLVLLADDVHAQLDAFIADENRRPRDELAHLVLALAAERAVKRVLQIAAADFAHSLLRGSIARLRIAKPQAERPPLYIYLLIPAVAANPTVKHDHPIANETRYRHYNQQFVNDDNSTIGGRNPL